MKSGKCPKCNSTEIFTSYGKSSLDSGLSTGDGQPLLRLRTAKSGLFGHYCITGNLNTYDMALRLAALPSVRDMAALRKSDGCANWRKV